MKHFINDRNAIVTEALDLAVLLSEGKIARLDGYPAIKVAVRTDWDKSQVAVISGGGAGHEPAHAGFVGDGMLTAAVCGEIFASPSVDAVLAAILAVTGKPGCLLIVKNYTGDRLNFGLAAEKARTLGFDVEMVIVGDDIAIEGATRPRGIAGTLLVHKVAGHLARSGASLGAVRDAAARVAFAVKSLGLSFSTCTIPGQEPSDRIGPSDVELGLGIHGEPGAETIGYRPPRDLARVLVERLERSIGDTKGQVALLVNDLGGVPPIEMAVAARSLVQSMTREVAIVFGPGRLMTSLDMKGISLSVLPLDGELEHALLSPVGPRDWPIGRRLAAIAPLALPAQLKPVHYAPSSNALRRRVVETICASLIAQEAALDALDAKVGDGDTGTTLATAARAIQSELDTLPFAEASALCASIGARLSTVMGGSSGILLSIGFSAMGTALATNPDWVHALREGIGRISHYGGAGEGERTMLDALIPAAKALESGQGLAAAAASAKAGAERTKSMTARAGRSTYVPDEALRGHADPGAVAFANVLEAIANVCL